MLKEILAFADSLVEEARKIYGAGNELRVIAYEDGTRRVAFDVLYYGELVFEVGFLTSADPRRFFKLTNGQAKEAFQAFFQTEGGRAA